MRQMAILALIAVAATMAVGLPAVFADTLDSLVTIATNARAQVQFQLERAQNIPDDLKNLFEQGSNETEMLISAAKQDDVAGSKQHFLAAMKAFKEISVRLSSPQEAASQKAAPQPQVPQSTLKTYGDSIDRTEKYASLLKDLVARNNFTVDFSTVDKLIANARSNLAAEDIDSVDKIFVDLKNALIDVQDAIREQTIQSQNDRAKSFANDYIAKINAMLAQSEQLGLQEDDIARLQQAKEEIASTNDPNQLIIIIKHYSINFTAPSEPAQQQTKNQAILETASKLDARLDALAPSIDDSIKPKFDQAKQLVQQLQNSTSIDASKLVDSLQSMINEIQSYVDSRQEEQANMTEKQQVQTEQKLQPHEQASVTAASEKPSDKPAEKPAETKKQEPKQNPQVTRLDARLAEIAPYVDDSIKPKFDTAQSLLLKLKDQGTTSKGEYDMTMRVLNYLVNDLEKSVKTMQEHAKDQSKDTGNKNSDNGRGNQK